MEIIKVKDKKFSVSKKQLQEIKLMGTKELGPKKSLDFEQVAVYSGNNLICYVALKILEEIVRRKKIVLLQ